MATAAVFPGVLQLEKAFTMEKAALFRGPEVQPASRVILTRRGPRGRPQWPRAPVAAGGRPPPGPSPKCWMLPCPFGRSRKNSKEEKWFRWGCALKKGSRVDARSKTIESWTGKNHDTSWWFKGFTRCFNFCNYLLYHDRAVKLLHLLCKSAISRKKRIFLLATNYWSLTTAKKSQMFFKLPPFPVKLLGVNDSHPTNKQWKLTWHIAYLHFLVVFNM